MNPKMTTLTTLAALAAFAVLGLNAQARAEEHDETDKPRTEGRRAGKGRGLDLTPEQKKQFKLAMRARRDAVQPLRDKLHDEREALSEMLKSGATDKDITPALERITALRDKIQAENKKFREKAAAALTPTQRAKMLVGGHGNAWGQGGRGRMGRGGRGKKGEGRWRR